MIELKNDEESSKLNLENNTLKVLLFYIDVDWFSECMEFKKRIENISNLEEYKDIEFISINAEFCKNAVIDYNIKRVPTLVILNNCSINNYIIGIKIDDEINNILKNEIEKIKNKDVNLPF